MPPRESDPSPPVTEAGVEPSPDARLSPSAFAERFASSYRLFRLVALGIVRDGALADDVCQEAAIVALGKLDRFEAGTNFNAWMSRMIRFVALNQARKERRRAAADIDVETVERSRVTTRSEPGEKTTPGRSLRLTPAHDLPENQDAFDDAVVAALDRVNEIARSCLLLRVVEGLEYREIARVLDIPEGTAMSHVHRSRRRLRELLGDRGDRS